jgi:hypothetical protein
MAEVENPQSKIFAQPLAVGLGVALLLGYGFATLHAIYEKSHRASIENADASSAVGDRAFFTKSFDPTLPLVNFEGHSLYFVERKEAADTSMIKTGMDDANIYAIYKLAGAKDEEASFVYLKIGPNYYAKVKRQ